MFICFALLFHTSSAFVHPSSPYTVPNANSIVHLTSPFSKPRRLSRSIVLFASSTSFTGGVDDVRLGTAIDGMANTKFSLQPLKQTIDRFARKFSSKKRGIPQSKTIPILDNTQTATKQALKFLLKLFLELTCVASALASVSIYFLHAIKRDFVVTNFIRWLAVSLTLKFIMFHNQINSVVPSLDRGEGSDWFLQGTFHIQLNEDQHSNAEPHNRDGALVEARIRQVPGNGACLFHAIGAGILYEHSVSNNANEVDSERRSHPPMSEVIEYSSKLRTLAADTLESGIKPEVEAGSGGSETQLIMQNDESISASALVQNAAKQYGVTPGEYVSKVRQVNVWGGGPEIVCLANCIKRQIILLEPTTEDRPKKESLYLSVIARFGPPSKAQPIYILSTNQQFPKEHYGKPSNHFLVVFPSRPCY